MSSLNRASVVPVLVGTFIIFFAGYYSASFVEATTTYRPDLSKFWEVSELMHSHFPFKDKIPSTSKQIEGAISGLVASYGDPYTTYLSKNQLNSLKDSVEGSFSGIGVEVGMKDNLLTVITPIKGSPAEKAGFLTGDIIYKVDSEDVSSLPIDEIIQKIRGPKGTTIAIEVVRRGLPKPITLLPIRDTIAIPTTRSEHQGQCRHHIIVYVYP
jgi:carboxyl-terminal processing protease